MSRRHLLNLPPARQSELSGRYNWLKDVHECERDRDVRVASISVFDHWLSRTEACELLERVSPTEQARRDALHAAFCAALKEKTEVISFAFRGRRKDRIVFRKFISKHALASYLTPHGGKLLTHRQFHVVLPEFGCAFYESWDDTNHLFFKGTELPSLIAELAKQNGLHVLSHG